MRTFVIMISLLLFGNSVFSQDKSLQAILLVGPQEDGTFEAIKEMNVVADFLISKGVKVHKFYNRQTQWDKIVEVAKDCNFFIYSGHGSDQGIDGNVGGLCFNEIISTTRILESLKLRKNSMVLFQSVCYGAGSSASDESEIKLETARKRVEDYANPFFEIGASFYYANNYSRGVYGFLNLFFEGKDASEIYHATLDGRADVELDQPSLYDPNKSVCVSSSESEGFVTITSYRNGIKSVKKRPAFKGYDIAMVGNKKYNLKILSEF